MHCPVSEVGKKQNEYDPYEQFLVGQRQRELGWKAVRDSKRAKASQQPAPTIVTSSSASLSQDTDVVTVLRQQLASKTEECRHLMNRLNAIDDANSKIISSQKQLQESFIKVSVVGCGF